jgi:hypothetical protein
MAARTTSILSSDHVRFLWTTTMESSRVEASRCYSALLCSTPIAIHNHGNTKPQFPHTHVRPASSANLFRPPWLAQSQPGLGRFQPGRLALTTGTAAAALQGAPVNDSATQQPLRLASSAHPLPAVVLRLHACASGLLCAVEPELGR